MAPLFFLALSADEGGQVHEEVERALDERVLTSLAPRAILPHTGFWMLAIGLPVITLAAFLFRVFRRLPVFSALASGKCLAGAVVFFTSALAIESLSNFVDPKSAGMWLQVAGEELGEMIGVSLWLWGGWAAVQRPRAGHSGTATNPNMSLAAASDGA